MHNEVKTCGQLRVSLFAYAFAVHCVSVQNQTTVKIMWTQVHKLFKCQWLSVTGTHTNKSKCSRYKRAAKFTFTSLNHEAVGAQLNPVQVSTATEILRSSTVVVINTPAVFVVTGLGFSRFACYQYSLVVK